MGPHAPDNGSTDSRNDSAKNPDSDPAVVAGSRTESDNSQDESLQLLDQDELSGLSEDDDYITSDEEVLRTVMSSDDQRHHFAYGSSFAEHTEYFSQSLSNALDSVKLDKSLVAQAQLSGHLNNKSQKLAEKHDLLVEKISNLRNLYNYHIGTNRIGELEKDLGELHSRIDNLRGGMAKSLLFGRKGTVGVAEKYPIEYNQAKDKVLERMSD